ncbi:DNA-binding response regulator [Anaerobacillus arseniciselenatis]|uniref:DNA-binding response regulator n=1 Tax=Anaerobacillus arseniciselenatis TaxID=85682 RepID=A0A1S2LGD0_9BACI|nr:response regulator transcription factor [Anaerobacillus arseniciselenatis]OIJ11599.1 DNA-binding response regulator [Anaerobacillus arseniciselenatis]
MTVKIMLVDDHPVFRSGLKNIILTEANYEIVAEAENGKMAIEKALEIKPDIIIMDINMPEKDGIEATKAIKEVNSNIKILILTMYSDEAYLKEGLKVGASGYVLKRAVDTELVTAIQTVVRGEHYIYPTLIPSLYTKSQETEMQSDAEDSVDLLSAREKEVLKFIALGYTQKEISTELFISIKTVDTYKTRIMEKIGAKKKSGLVRYALKHDILTSLD